MGVSISAANAQGLEGVAFIATREDGAAQRCFVAREALEDVEYALFESPQAMLEAFARHQAQVASAADQALAAPQRGDPVQLQSLL